MALSSEPQHAVSFGRGWVPAGRDIGLPGDVECPEAGPVRAFVSRHNGWTPARKVMFLDALAREGNVRAACARAGMSREAAYRLRRRDAGFAQGWAAALVLARETVGQLLADRAINGVEEAVFYHGEQVAVRRRFDGRLLLAHLARLDKLADETSAGEHAGRFDELLAVIAGEAPPPELFEVIGFEEEREEPLLPLPREIHAAREAHRADWALSVGGDDAESDGSEWDEPQWGESSEDGAECEERADAAPLAPAQARAAAAAQWDGWFAHACTLVDRLAGSAPERAETALEERAPGGSADSEVPQFRTPEFGTLAFPSLNGLPAFPAKTVSIVSTGATSGLSGRARSRRCRRPQ